MTSGRKLGASRMKELRDLKDLTIHDVQPHESTQTNIIRPFQKGPHVLITIQTPLKGFDTFRVPWGFRVQGSGFRVQGAGYRV